MAQGHGETALLGHYLNKLSSQNNNAVNIGIGGYKDDWFHNQVKETGDPARKLIMKKRYDNPFLHVLLSKMPKKRLNKQVFDWDEQEYVPTGWTPVTEDAVRTRIRLSTTDVKFLQDGDYLSVDGIYTVVGDDGNTYYSTVKFGKGTIGTALTATVPETVKVISRDLTTGYVTVERGVGGNVVGSGANGDLTYQAPYITSSMKLYIAGNVFNEISDGVGGFRRNPTRLYGAIHLTKSKSWYSTEIEDNVDYVTTKPIQRQAEEARTTYLKGIDRGMLHAWRLGGVARNNVYSTTSLEYQSTSIMENIPATNFINYNKVLNMMDFNKSLRAVFDVGSSVKYGFTTRAIVDELFWMNQQMVVFNERVSISIGLPTYDYMTTTGQTLRLIVEPEMEKFTMYANSILILDMGDEKGEGSTNPDPYLQYMYLQNMDMKIKTVDGGKLADTISKQQYYYGVIGVKVAFAESHFFMYNILSRVS